jgi:hypothetical protein
VLGGPSIDAQQPHVLIGDHHMRHQKKARSVARPSAGRLRIVSLRDPANLLKNNAAK